MTSVHLDLIYKNEYLGLRSEELLGLLGGFATIQDNTRQEEGMQNVHEFQ